MRVFLSTVGTRGDVQPVLALATELRRAGHDSTICAAPDFGEWVAASGFAFVPVGPPLRNFPLPPPGAHVAPSPERRRELAALAVHGQFAVLRDAARDHDVLVAAGALQFATRSVAERMGVPYVFAAYSPNAIPSPAHPPVRMDTFHPPTLSEAENRALWAAEARHWDELFSAALGEERTRLGLSDAGGVLEHIQTRHPWLAADPVLGPVGPTEGLTITQTGAWRLPDPTPLPAALDAFLSAGEPPVYLGFGSMRDGAATGRALLEAARAVGRRAVVSRGWGGLAPEADGRDDWIAVDDVSHDLLLPRVAAVVHHGGAGHTTAAAAAGRPQVIVPHHYDQGWWAHRVASLGIGVALPSAAVEVDAVATALDAVLRPDVEAASREIARKIQPDGARVAAERLIALAG